VVLTLSIHAVVLGLQPRQLLLTAIHTSTIVIYKGLSFWLIYIVQKLGIAMVVCSGHDFGVLCILHAEIWFLGMYIITNILIYTRSVRCIRITSVYSTVHGEIIYCA
jgi:hypothetical protein